MSSGKRYKFNGSSFAIQTALEAARTINTVTKADPAVVTSPSHGYSNFDVVKLNVDVGMTELDGTLAVVANKAANTYQLSGVDSTGYTTFVNDSPSTGYAQRVTFTQFCELTSFNQQDAAADEIDVTTICSTQKEFEVGLSDSGSLSLEYNWAGNQTVQAALIAAKISGDTVAFKLILPNSGGTIIMFGSVQAQSISGGVSDVIKGTATIKLTGEIFVLA